MQTPSDSTCLFCGIAAGRIPAKVYHSDDHVMAFSDISPAAPFHALIIPKKHVGPLTESARDEAEVIGKMVTVASELAREHGLQEGYRLNINQGAGAGQTVSHLHLHLLGKRAFHWPPG